MRFVAYQPVTTGALAAAESGVRLLTQAAIEKLPFWERPHCGHERCRSVLTELQMKLGKMTKDQLLAVLDASFKFPRQAVPGGFLFCHTPDEGEFAYLGRVYEPASPWLVSDWAARACHSGHPYLTFLATVANGLRIANINLYGVIEHIMREMGAGAGQPISLDDGNLHGRPSGLSDSDMVIGGTVGWSSHGVYVMGISGSIRLVHQDNGDNVADEWGCLHQMLHSELIRVGSQYGPNRELLTNYTTLMHPAGRRWETKNEPVIILH